MSDVRFTRSVDKAHLARVKAAREEHPSVADTGGRELARELARRVKRRIRRSG